MRMIKNILSIIAFCFLMWAHVEAFDEMAKDRERDLARWKQHRIWIEREPWRSWVEVTPDGEPEEHALCYAERDGVPLWVLREGGDSYEVPYEEGVSFLAELSVVDTPPPN